MFGHDNDSGRACACFRRAAGVVAVEEIVEAGHVRRVRRSPGVAQLLEVEDAGRLERLEERRDQSR
jgi:hypothetical protein